MSVLAQISSWHFLLWAVPLVMAMICSAIGGRLGRRGAEWLAAAGLFWPFLQAAASAVYFLWFSHGEGTGFFVLSLPGTQGDFAWSFALDRVGCWATCLAGALVLMALAQAVIVTRGWIGRHRYFALIMLALASMNVLATARSLLALLLGWEGSLLATAFMLGFWEAEEAEKRTGMRWLLFQHLSTVCLLVGWLLLPEHPQSSLVFILICLTLRLGLVPGHGWVVEQSRAHSSAQAVVQTMASLLASAVLMDRFAPLLLTTSWAVGLMQAVGIISSLVGALAAIQQHRLAARLSWLVMISAGLVALSFFLRDLAAARLLVTAHALAWCASILILGVVEVYENPPGCLPERHPYRRLCLGLALSLVAPPGLSALALGRLFLAVEDVWWRVGLALSLAFAFTASGYVMGQLGRTLERMFEGEETTSAVRVRGVFAASWAGMVLVFVLGALLLALEKLSPQVFGDWIGLLSSFLIAGVSAGGFFLGFRLRRVEYVPVLSWRRGRWWMEQLAETGLGMGELVVRLPLLVFQVLGVLLARVLGDFFLEGVVIGGTVRLWSGLGRVLQYLHNGQVQRYLFLLLLLVLALVWSLR